MDLISEIEKAIKILQKQEDKDMSYSFEYALLVLLKAVSQILKNHADIRRKLLEK